MTLRIGYFYPNLLNLYGDNGNIEVLVYRAQKRDIAVEVIKVTPNTQVDANFMKEIDLLFMGGGPDSSQKGVYKDLVKNKGSYIREYIENDGFGLFICGSYQLLGNYYKSADGSILDGLGIFDLHTEHFGNHKPRCVGNVLCTLDHTLRHDFVFNQLNKIGPTLVGFENHGGRTYLGPSALPLATINTGFGNNGEDKTEGILYKKSIGTYLHGPLLSKNPHLADYLIAKSLGLEELSDLDDNLVNLAHTASKSLAR